MFNSVAITKIQSVILISIITVAAVGGTIAYVLLQIGLLLPKYFKLLKVGCKKVSAYFKRKD